MATANRETAATCDASAMASSPATAIVRAMNAMGIVYSRNYAGLRAIKSANGWVMVNALGSPWRAFLGWSWGRG